MEPADRGPGCSRVADGGSHHVPVKTVKTMQTQAMPHQADAPITSVGLLRRFGRWSRGRGAVLQTVTVLELLTAAAWTGRIASHSPRRELLTRQGTQRGTNSTHAHPDRGPFRLEHAG